MSDIKVWIERTEKFGIAGWGIAIGLTLMGMAVLYGIHLIIFSGRGPWINYLLIAAIIFTGYKLWMASIAWSASKQMMGGLFSSLFQTLTSKNIDRENIGDVLTEELIEKKVLTLARKARNSSRKFLWMGIVFGMLFGVINKLILIDDPAIQGFWIYTAFGALYGLLWTMCGWSGIIPIAYEA